MFEAADYIAFVLAGLVGLGIGRVQRRRKATGDVCETCGHGYGFHKDGGSCKKTKWDNTCKCGQYIGPPPVWLGGSSS